VTKTSNAAETGMEWVDLAKAGKAGVPTPIRKLLISSCFQIETRRQAEDSAIARQGEVDKVSI
jgi:hypothetical protein